MIKFPHVPFSPRWRVMPYDIHGVKLFAVEKGNHTECYLDTRAEAEERVGALKEQDDENIKDRP